MSEAREAAWKALNISKDNDPISLMQWRVYFDLGYDAAKAESANPAESPESLSISNPANPKAEPVTIERASVAQEAINAIGNVPHAVWDANLWDYRAPRPSDFAEAVRTALAAQPVTGVATDKESLTVEWGALFRRDGRIENYPTREKAAARAAESTQISDFFTGKLIRDVPPSDPEQGRALVSRTVSEWVEVPNE